jgi:hypothetical protein
MASSSRQPARLAVSLLAVPLLAGACGQGAPPARNVILITCDTLRPDRLGVYGSREARRDRPERGAVQTTDTALAWLEQQEARGLPVRAARWLEGEQVPMDEAELRDLRALGHAEAAPGGGGK